MTNKALILGAGSWGQGLACVFSRQMTIDLWMRDANKISDIEHKIVSYITQPVNFISQIDDLQQYCVIIIAIPMNALREILLMLLTITNNSIDCLPDLFITCKGLEQSTGKLAYEIVEEIIPNLSRYGMLVGPSFASELIQNMPTLIALSAFDQEFTMKWLQKLKIPNFRIYGHSDVVGACCSSALKNVIAIAVGISHGLFLGQNTAAALITRGLYEMKKFIIATGGNDSSVYGLTGMGDLILTCHEQSRNYQVGIKLAQGLSIKEITNNLGHVAEGVSTAKEVFIRANTLGIEMPISKIVYEIIYEGLNIKEAISKLLDRPSKMEN